MWDLAVYAFFFAWSTAALVLLGGWCLGALQSRVTVEAVNRPPPASSGTQSVTGARHAHS